MKKFLRLDIEQLQVILSILDYTERTLEEIEEIGKEHFDAEFYDYLTKDQLIGQIEVFEDVVQSDMMNSYIELSKLLTLKKTPEGLS